MENVITYFEELSGVSNRPLVDLWKQNWMSKGWNPIVLGLADAQAHPHSFLFERKISELPTVNSRDYENACWRRWMAYERYFCREDCFSVSALFVDYDVFNLSLAPESLFPRGDIDAIFFSTVRTSALLANWQFTKDFVTLVLSGKGVLGIGESYGKPHCSDMTLAATLNNPIIDLCPDFPDLSRDLVHISSNSASQARQPKADIFRKLLSR